MATTTSRPVRRSMLAQPLGESGSAAPVDLEAGGPQLVGEAPHGGDDEVDPLAVASAAQLGFALDQQDAIDARLSRGQGPDGPVELVPQHPDRPPHGQTGCRLNPPDVGSGPG